MTIVQESLPAEKRGFLGRLWEMLIHPRNGFLSLRESGEKTWLIIAGLVILFSLLPVLVAAPITSRMAEESIREALGSQAQGGQNLPPEAQAQATQMVTSPIFTVLFPGITVIIGLAFSWLIWSGALHLFGTILGGSSSFGQMWRAVVWSWLPFGFRGLMQTLFTLVTGEVILNPGLSGLVAEERSIADIIAQPPSTGQMVLQSLLGQIDLFVIWNLVLLVIAVWATARLSGRKSILITSVIWLVLTLLGLIPVFISTLFTGGFGG